MVWNAPNDQKPNDSKAQDKDPWTGRPKKDNGAEQGPPLLDEAIKKLFGHIQKVAKGNRPAPGNQNNDSGSVVPGNWQIWLLALIILGWFFLGLKQISRDQEGIVMRFGVYQDSLSQGWHWRPFGIERILVFDRSKQYQETVTTDILSEDLDLAQVSVQIKYHVNNPRLYLFNFKDPAATIRSLVAQSAVQTAATQNLDSLFANEKDNAFIRSLQATLTANLDQYNLGVRIDDVQLGGVAVPDGVKEVFDKIDALYAEQAKQKQQAQDYEQQILPPAQAKADQMIAQAKSYADQVQLKAQEDVADFLAELPAYQKAPEVTRYRLYMEAMQDILNKTPKVIVDSKAGTPIVNLPPFHNEAVNNGNGNNASATTSDTPNASAPILPTASNNTAVVNTDDGSNMYASAQGGY